MELLNCDPKLEVKSFGGRSSLAIFKKGDLSEPLVIMPVSDLHALVEWLDMCVERDELELENAGPVIKQVIAHQAEIRGGTESAVDKIFGLISYLSPGERDRLLQRLGFERSN